MKFLSLQHELPEFRCALPTLKDRQRDAQVSTQLGDEDPRRTWKTEWNLTFLPASKDLHVSPCPFVPLWWHCATEIFRLISYVYRTDSLRSLRLLRELRLLMVLFWTQSTQSCRRVCRGAWSGIEHFVAASKPPCFSVFPYWIGTLRRTPDLRIAFGECTKWKQDTFLFAFFYF